MSIARLAVLVLVLRGAAADAGEILALEVANESRVYTVSADVVIYAPVHAVRAALTDFTHLERVNPAILESAVLANPEPGTTRVRTRIEACSLVFCRELTRIEDVRSPDEDRLEARLVAEGSDFRAGHSAWRLLALGAHTRLTYQSRMEPDFWVPPLLGPAMIRRALQRELRTTFANLERLAQGRAQRTAE